MRNYKMLRFAVNMDSCSIYLKTSLRKYDLKTNTFNLSKLWKKQSKIGIKELLIREKHAERSYAEIVLFCLMQNHFYPILSNERSINGIVNKTF